MKSGLRDVRWRRLAILLLIGGGLAFAAYSTPSLFFKNDNNEMDASPKLRLGGTESGVSMMDRWKFVYQKEKGMTIDYDSIGSTKGINGMVDKNYLIGFTHAPISPEQKEKARLNGGEVVQIPLVICAVAPVYNLKELKGKPPLQLTGEVLADIFLGKIKKWNDTALVELNKNLNLPDAEIVVIHRADSSGTTLTFTEYLSEVSSAWRKSVGKPASKIEWPVGVGVQRNSGVAMKVMQDDGAIGYVDLIHVAPYKLEHAALENKDKNNFIQADPKSMSAAAGEVTNIQDDLTFDVLNQKGKDSYPICGAIWAVCYRNQSAANFKPVTDFLRWATDDGQKYVTKLSHAPLPKSVSDRVRQKLQSIRAEP